MHRKTQIVIGIILLVLIISSRADANSPLRLIIDGNKQIIRNGEDVLQSIPLKLDNDHVFVPVRELFEALGATVGWNGEHKTVIINTRKKLWEDQIEPWDADILEAQAVISRYYAYLIGSSKEDLSTMATENAMEPFSQQRLTTRPMLTEFLVTRYEFLDIRKTEGKVQVAVRRYIVNEFNTRFLSYVDIIYDIVWESRTGAEGQGKVPLIDKQEVIDSQPAGDPYKIW